MNHVKLYWKADDAKPQGITVVDQDGREVANLLTVKVDTDWVNNGSSSGMRPNVRLTIECLDARVFEERR